MADEQVQDQQPTGGLSKLEVGTPVSLTGGGKGQLANVVAPNGMLMDETTGKAVLQNMKDLVDQYNDPMRNFQNSLQRMHAWTVYDKTPAFQQINAQEEQERAAKYNLAQQMAVLQASQLQAQRDANRINQIKEQGMGGTGGTSNLPPRVLAALNSVDPRDINAQKAILNNYFKTDINESTKMGYNPSSFVSKETFIPEIGQSLDLTPPEVKAYTEKGEIPKRFGIQSPNAPTTTSANIPVAGRAASLAQNLGVPIISGDRDMAKSIELWNASQQPGYKGPPVAYPGTSQHLYGNAIDVDKTKFTDQDRQKLLNAGFTNPFPEKDKYHYELPSQKASLLASNQTPKNVVEPVTNTAQTGFVPPYPKPLNAAQVNANMAAEQDYRKANLNVVAKEAETSATEAGKRKAEMDKLSEAALEAIPAAEKVLEITEDPKRNKVAGYLHGTDPVATALYTVSKHLSNKMPNELEEEFVTNRLTPQQLDDYRTLTNSSQKLGIQYAADVFKGARMGIGLEKMAMGAKGIGSELPPEVNARNARLIRDASQFQIDKQKMFADWAKENGGRLASFEEFERTPQYEHFRDTAKQKFLNDYKGLVRVESISPQEAAKAELEQRAKQKGKQ